MPLLPRWRALLALVVLVCCSSQPSLAQQGSGPDPSPRPVSTAFAITNARVVQAPGRVMERANVIVRDGLITAVAVDARIPTDAHLIAGDSLVVYAGFIDALAHAGLDVPSADTSDRVPDPDDPPRTRSGVLPDRLARLYLDPDDSGLARLREAGFTVAHVAPAGGLFSGQSAVILLAGERPDDMILVPDAALVARFSGGSGVYPSTPMGVAATMRERFRQAAQARDAVARYDADPAGRRRPLHDPVATALLPALEGRQRVFFVAESALEGQRALRLADEIGFQAVLAGIPEVSIMREALRQRGATVLAPLALPDAVEPDTTVADTPARDLAAHLGGEIFVSERRTRSHLDVDDETRHLQERRGISVALFERNALTLQEAGIPFAFASLGESPGDFRANLRRMIAAGLTADDALAALTTAPAQLLGLQRTLGTVEPGRMANLVVTNGDYFAEDTRIRYVFVDGRRYEVEASRPDADPDAEVTVTGTWDYTLVLPDQSISGRMTFEGEPGALSGTLQIPDLGSLAIRDIRVEGNQLSFSVPDTPLGTATASGVIVGNTFEGEIRTPGAPAMPLTATRRPN
jgi:imidazolonepropionase-like amidohydrolase